MVPFLDPVPRLRCQLHIFFLLKIDGKAEGILYPPTPFPPFTPQTKSNGLERLPSSSFWSVCSLLPSIFICRYSSDSCVIHGQSEVLYCVLPPPRPWSSLGPCAERCRTLGMYSALSLCEIWSVFTLHSIVTSKLQKAEKRTAPLQNYFASPRTWTWPSRSSARLNSLCITLQHYLFLSLRISLQPRCCLRG